MFSRKNNEKNYNDAYVWVDGLNVRRIPGSAQNNPEAFSKDKGLVLWDKIKPIDKLHENQKIKVFKNINDPGKGYATAGGEKYTLRGQTIVKPFVKIEYASDGKTKEGWVFEGGLIYGNLSSVKREPQNINNIPS